MPCPSLLDFIIAECQQMAGPARQRHRRRQKLETRGRKPYIWGLFLELQCIDCHFSRGFCRLVLDKSLLCVLLHCWYIQTLFLISVFVFHSGSLLILSWTYHTIKDIFCQDAYLRHLSTYSLDV